MIEIIILLAMIECHIIDDFHIQGVLANMKQKQWWKEHAPDKMYERDYIVTLIAHSFSWAFAIHIPCIIYAYICGSPISTLIFLVFLAFFIACVIIHAITDHEKANLHTINLFEDQGIHLFQIIMVWQLWIQLIQ